jgi:serine/threonine protein kinase
MPDRLLGNYFSLGYLGHGSMGHVWLAFPAGKPDERVVVKFMHPSAARQPHFREMFRREIQSMSTLNHPYIVRLLDTSPPSELRPALVMEYVPGSTLEKVLAKRRVPRLPHVGMILGRLCHALDYAHDRGIIHRDLKPCNLMIVNEGRSSESLKVMDFGLAQFDSRPHISTDKLLGRGVTNTVGTPGYVSPEAIRGDAVDARADLYSVGCLLYLMLTGQPPFPQASPRELMRAHLQDRPRSFESLGVRHVPPAVEAVVLKCLSKFPVERPITARELARLFGKVAGIDIWEQTKPAEPIAPKKPFDSKAPLFDGKSIIRQVDTRMPEGIAIVKLRGFLADVGGRVVKSEPGLLRIQVGEAPTRSKGLSSSGAISTSTTLPVEIELLMEKPDPRDSRLTFTIYLRPFTDPVLFQRPDWRRQCQHLLNELQSYLMAV